jgi:large subunit ribosomal protein L31
MKKDIHPKYQNVLFVDSSTGHKFVCGTTLQPKGKETFEGKEYPVFYVSISSASHPFFTGSKQMLDAEGRVDKFRKRYTAAPKKEEKPAEEKQEEGKQDQGKKGTAKKAAPKAKK